MCSTDYRFQLEDANFMVTDNYEIIAHSTCRGEDIGVCKFIKKLKNKYRNPTPKEISEILSERYKNHYRSKYFKRFENSNEVLNSLLDQLNENVPMIISLAIAKNDVNQWRKTLYGFRSILIEKKQDSFYLFDPNENWIKFDNIENLETLFNERYYEYNCYRTIKYA